jgi:NitT/TauT family transport system permease protein
MGTGRGDANRHSGAEPARLYGFPTTGAELACVFAIFTSQAWNMTFSMYQSLRNVPKDLEEATQSFHLSGWQRFWRLDVPYAMPGLIWNTMMSMSGGWFFVVASEAIAVGNIGSHRSALY